MKNRLYFLFIILSTLCLNVDAQELNSTSKFNPDQLVFGADIGFGISNNYWNVGISPQIGYKLTEKFHVGAGISYLHGQSRDDNYYDYTENSVGLNLFAHYYPWKRFMFRLKPELMYTWYKSDLQIVDESGIYRGKYSDSKFVPAVIVGGGIHLKPVMLLLNYELVQNKYSSYSDNVFLSIGFMF